MLLLFFHFSKEIFYNMYVDFYDMLSQPHSSSTIKELSLIHICMAVCSLVASVVVAFVGIISFVGLLAPHIMRRFIGNDYRFLLPTSALTGAVLLLTADTFGRLIVAPIILPIGAITSFLGAPLFLYLLFKGVGKA